MRAIRSWVVVIAAATTALVAACGAEPAEEATTPEPSEDPSDPAPTSTADGQVSFADIHPVLVRTCGEGACHGAGSTMGTFAAADLEAAEAAASGQELLMIAMIEIGTMPKDMNCLSESGVWSTASTCLSEQERADISAWALGN
jgi:hypothetical protein